MSRGVKGWGLVLLLLLAPAAQAKKARRPPPPHPNQALAELRVKINRVLSTPELAPCTIGCLIVRPNGQVVYQQNADKLFVPASNMKLFISAAALEVLGGDYRCHTRVCAVAGIGAEGALKGDLFLVGGGDPMLSYDDLKQLAQTLWDKGLRKVEGGVVGDESLFVGQRLGDGWSWDDLPWYYAPEISALSLGHNQVNVVVRSNGSVGEPAVVSIHPPNSYVTVENRATTGARDGFSGVAFNRELNGKAIQVSGTVPLGAEPFNQRCAVWNPCLYTATVLTELLRAKGVEVCDTAKVGTAPQALTELTGVDSPPVREMVAAMNKPSDNHIAEMLLRLMGVKHRGRGSVAAGVSALENFLERQRIPTDTLRFSDGSGLSRFNLVTPRAVVQLLRAMTRHREFDAFHHSLPVAGVDGTLRLRMQGAPARRSVRAKTGSLRSVSSLSGYVATKTGERLTFSLLFNNYTLTAVEVRAAQDRVCELLAGAKL